MPLFCCIIKQSSKDTSPHFQSARDLTRQFNSFFIDPFENGFVFHLQWMYWQVSGSTRRLSASNSPLVKLSLQSSTRANRCRHSGGIQIYLIHQAKILSSALMNSYIETCLFNSLLLVASVVPWFEQIPLCLFILFCTPLNLERKFFGWKMCLLFLFFEKLERFGILFLFCTRGAL